MIQIHLIPHFSFFILFLNTSDVQNIVASHKNLTKVTGEATIYVLFSVGQLNQFKKLELIKKRHPDITNLKIHVSIYWDEITFVLVSPLEFYHDRFAGKAVEERLRVNWHRRLYTINRIIIIVYIRGDF